LVVLLIALAFVSAIDTDRKHMRTHMRARAHAHGRAHARAHVGANWYDTALPAQFCGITTNELDTAAFAQWDTAFKAAYGDAGTACGGKTSRQVFDMIKAAQVQAVATPPVLTGFDGLATACAADLTGTTTGYALWSGGYLCSQIAQSLFHQTSLESTKLGSVLNAVFNWPTVKALETSWKACCGKMWNAVSIKFVAQMSGTVTVFFRYAGTDSVLYKQELPALQALFTAGTVTKVNFEVVLPDTANACGVVDGLHTEVTVASEGILAATLLSVAARANALSPGSVGVDKVSY